MSSSSNLTFLIKADFKQITWECGTKVKKNGIKVQVILNLSKWGIKLISSCYNITGYIHSLTGNQTYFFICISWKKSPQFIFYFCSNVVVILNSA